MKSEPVLIDRIQVVDRIRSNLREETVTQIMESIPRVGGLLHPIAIRFVDGFAIEDDIIDGVPVLVAGRHRLEAMKRLGSTHIDCLIFETERQARRWEISENLHRSDLDRQQRSEHESEWVKMEDDEADDLILGHGVRELKSTKNPKGAGAPESGIAKAARELPIPGRTDEAKRKHLSRSILIAEKTTPEAKAAAREAGLSNSTTALVEIARAAPEQQVAKVQEIIERKSAPKPPKPMTADKALEVMAKDIVSSEAPPWAEEDAQFDALCRAYSVANGAARMRFLEWAGLRK